MPIGRENASGEIWNSSVSQLVHTQNVVLNLYVLEETLANFQGTEILAPNIQQVLKGIGNVTENEAAPGNIINLLCRQFQIHDNVDNVVDSRLLI